MKRATAVLSTAAVVLWAAGVFAQAKPDFSGTWALDAEKTAAEGGAAGGARGGRGGGGGAMTLKQDATSLTRTAGREGAQPVVFKLDGSETQVPMGRGGMMATAKAMWEANTIVITTTRDMQGTMVTTKEVYSMEGDWLVVATTAPPRGGGDPTTTKRYYKKGM
jgi:hypothetical protein